MAQTLETDVVVLGVGPGGEYAANKLGSAGLEVVAVDADLVGGECPFYGCTPSKLLVRGAEAVAHAREVPGLGGEVDVRPDLGQAAARIRKATNDWHDHTHVERLEKAGVRILRGRGRLDGPGRVEVTLLDGSTVSVRGRRGVVLGTGTRPAELPIEGLAATPYWTNRTVFRAAEAPASLVVVGGGAIGCELAQSFARFGTQVTLLESAPRIMAAEEPETSEVITRAFRRDGVDVRTDARIERVGYDGHRYAVALADGSVVEPEQLLVAAGRTPNLDEVGLETVGLDPEARTVETDERMRAGDRLWAVGDITGCGPYTHVARYQAVAAVRDLLGEDGPWGEYHAVTRVTFTDPEVGGVGLTEAQAREAGLSVATGVASVAKSSRGWIHGGEPPADGVVKVVADTDRGILVGATTVAPYGGEVLGLLAAAVHARMPVETLRGMHFAYLTFHRVIQNALNQL
jgi:pyruvate/2-oxoglutarate dehydrogenase complex dihydrolipoamide dehydrogenase (E3) component